MNTNSYYHEFSIGFNFWMAAFVVMILVMVFLGVHQYRLERRQIIRQFDGRLLLTISGVMSLLFGIMLIVESGAGIVQYFDNGLIGNESPALSVISLPIAVIIVAVIVWAIFFSIGYVAGLAKAGQLFTHLEKLEQERAAKLARRNRPQNYRQKRW